MHSDLLQHGLELRGVPSLPCRNHDRHGFLTLLDRQVQLGGQAAARAPEPVVLRLGVDAAGRFDLQVPLSRAPAACRWSEEKGGNATGPTALSARSKVTRTAIRKHAITADAGNGKPDKPAAPRLIHTHCHRRLTTDTGKTPALLTNSRAIELA
ncbi:hypothetical protein OG936_14460 [Streptomyces sp. NBC_00846]|uniref:hypothetical protein n=1 Tax=Streptomyces sp. NBC_00846 TaxID=2975849 RepID=UPI00386B65F5|nr:hypothetical protein OG936_14460 [Streptomyces sp. NBC_00846]